MATQNCTFVNIEQDDDDVDDDDDDNDDVDTLVFYVPFNIIQVISRRWRGYN